MCWLDRIQSHHAEYLSTLYLAEETSILFDIANSSLSVIFSRQKQFERTEGINEALTSDAQAVFSKEHPPRIGCKDGASFDFGR